MDATKKKGVLYVIVALCLMLGVSIFLMLGPPKLLAKSDEPNFCAGCHVMEDEYEAWSHAGAHRRKKCVDCHLPNENMAVHYAQKAIDGMKDVMFYYSGKVSEQIKLSSHGEKVVQSNCVRCHEETVSLMDTSRKCWSCHRRISHKLAGTIETF